MVIAFEARPSQAVGLLFSAIYTASGSVTVCKLTALAIKIVLYASNSERRTYSLLLIRNTAGKPGGES